MKLKLLIVLFVSIISSSISSMHFALMEHLLEKRGNWLDSKFSNYDEAAERFMKEHDALNNDEKKLLRDISSRLLKSFDSPLSDLWKPKYKKIYDFSPNMQNALTDFSYIFLFSLLEQDSAEKVRIFLKRISTFGQISSNL